MFFSFGFYNLKDQSNKAKDDLPKGNTRQRALQIDVEFFIMHTNMQQNWKC